MTLIVKYKTKLMHQNNHRPKVKVSGSKQNNKNKFKSNKFLTIYKWQEK